MTLHLRVFINGQANYPAVRMIFFLKKYIYIWQHTLKTEKGGLMKPDTLKELDLSSFTEHFTLSLSLITVFITIFRVKRVTGLD